MIIRFGYVAHALSLWEASPAKTLTYARWNKMNEENRRETLERVTRQNLEHTLRALHFNIAHQIPLYRFSSSIVPLATHPEATWDYISPFRDLYKSIGNLVTKHQLRTSFHPNQFTLFTSDKHHITKNSVKDMTYHYRLLEAMGLEKHSSINIHVGGAYGDKQSAIERFHSNVQELPSSVKRQMTLENDDKTYTASEALEICEKEDLPMMFDYHHYQANNNDDEALEKVLPKFFSTWKNQPFLPKVHVSSPKSEEVYRSHADYVDPNFILPFLRKLKELNQDVDVMVEAKMKDKAVLQLVEELARIRGVKRISGAAIEW
ncbi:UV DNA damage repair endonuclease UvsE [Alteribacillus sp. HJP-4]|uniref:UV DNA damage repair endonuclease UvsE n=1 Tax=Alteribacillus sp. HJP-4 TaxID=2775394 RepID=UPI0035CCEA02